MTGTVKQTKNKQTNTGVYWSYILPLQSKFLPIKFHNTSRGLICLKWGPCGYYRKNKRIIYPLNRLTVSQLPNRWQKTERSQLGRSGQ